MEDVFHADFTYAWPGVSAGAPVDPVVKLRVCLQTEVHGARVRGQLMEGPGFLGDKGGITSRSSSEE